jgi:hypothetical protein
VTRLKNAAISEVVENRRRPAQSLAPHPGAWSVSWTSSRRRWRSPHWYRPYQVEMALPREGKHWFGDHSSPTAHVVLRVDA